jgi:hypothetical protein
MSYVANGAKLAWRKPEVLELRPDEAQQVLIEMAQHPAQFIVFPLRVVRRPLLRRGRTPPWPKGFTLSDAHASWLEDVRKIAAEMGVVSKGDAIAFPYCQVGVLSYLKLHKVDEKRFWREPKDSAPLERGLVERARAVRGAAGDHRGGDGRVVLLGRARVLRTLTPGTHCEPSLTRCLSGAFCLVGTHARRGGA